VAKQQKKYTITILNLLFHIISHAQSLSPQDSINFKHDFEALLKKYKLENKGYQINVQSNNQSGGQTAFIITNNYYKDPNLVPDSLNYIAIIKLEKDKKVLTVYPKSGSWIQPMLMYDSSDVDLGSKIFPLPFLYNSQKASLTFENKRFYVKGAFFVNAISKSQPLNIYLTDKTNEFYYFGDYADSNKRFIYWEGKIIWVPLK
jgi:hypothetical protein